MKKRTIITAILVAIMMLVPASLLLINASPANGAMVMPSTGQVPWSGKILHYELYITDGYINVASGGGTDPANIAGWLSPIYMWGFTDVDPGGALTGPNYLDLKTVPSGALVPAGGPVGNMKFPAPIIDVSVGDDVYITVHNRGFFQVNQTVQDEHTLHLHGIHAQAQYDGVGEEAGGYVEQMMMPWRSTAFGGPYASLTNLAPAPTGNALTTYLKDNWWNSMDAISQQKWMMNNMGSIPTVTNKLSPSGGVPSQFDLSNPAYPANPTNKTIEDISQYTYYFRAEHPGSTMYHCHVSAAEHVQMGMYGALIVRPSDYYPKDFNAPLTSNKHGKFFDINGNGVKDGQESYFIDTNKNGIVDVGDQRLNVEFIKLGTQTVKVMPGWVTISKTAYGIGTNTNYDKEYVWLFSEIDPIWHSDNEGAQTAFYPPDWHPQLWFVNGRTFPSTVGAFRYNQLEPKLGGGTWYRPEPRYDVDVNIGPNQTYLTRMINMGYTDHPIHQHGWHMMVVGTDMMPLSMPYMKFTINIGSGETYDTLTTANPVFGVTSPSGAPLDVSTQIQTHWRQVYVAHSHNDYEVTTGGIYPGGALILIEATTTGFQGPTWYNPYTNVIEPLPGPPV